MLCNVRVKILDIRDGCRLSVVMVNLETSTPPCSYSPCTVVGRALLEEKLSIAT